MSNNNLNLKTGNLSTKDNVSHEVKTATSSQASSVYTSKSDQRAVAKAAASYAGTGKSVTSSHNIGSNSESKRFLKADNAVTMLNFFSSKVETYDKPKQSHTDKISTLIDNYLPNPQYSLFKNKHVASSESTETNGTLSLSAYLCTPSQISFTTILPTAAFNGMTFMLNHSDNNLSTEHTSEKLSNADFISHNLQENLASQSLQEQHGIEYFDSSVEHLDVSFDGKDHSQEELGQNLSDALLAATIQTTCTDGVCSLDLDEGHGTTPTLDVGLLDSLLGREGLYHQGHATLSQTTELSNKLPKVHIPPQKNGAHYSQVATDDLMNQLDAEVFLQPYNSLDLFKEQCVLSNSSSYTLIETPKHKTIKTPPHAVFEELPSTLFSEELHNLLNQIIRNHERYCNVEHPELLTTVGYWCFDREEGGFSIDKAAAMLLGIEDYHRVISLAELYELFDHRHVEKILYNHQNPDAGMIFSDRLRLLNGPYAGLTLITQGSAVIRDPATGQVMISSGLICHELSPQADFIFRELAGDGMFIWNAENDVVHASSSYHAMMGYPKEAYPTSFTDFCQKLVHPDDYDALLIQQHVVRSPAYGNSFETCIRLKHFNGHYLWTIGRGLVIERNEKGVATKLIGSQSDINLVHQSFENINSLMLTDSLTELHNRSYFTQNAVRYESAQHSPISIVFVDVSGLKLTNDILGHNFGDYLILKCAIAMLQALQVVLAKSKLFGDMRDNLSKTIDHLTRKAFSQIYQDQENINKAEIMFTKANNQTRATFPQLKKTSTASFAEIGEDDSQENIQLQVDTIEQMLKNKMQPELIRLAGDELILVFPSCPLDLALMLKKESLVATRKMNALDRLSFPVDQRPVPLCYGIGVATVGETGPNDDFKQTLERADMRMLENKEKYHELNHKTLKDYFEQRLNRKVSMRDERREEVLSAQERSQLRQQKLNSSTSSPI